MNTPQTDTPETNTIATERVGIWERFYKALRSSEKLERQRNAAEARVKELDAERDEAIKARDHNRVCIERLTVERDEARAALRLRPIAEAGPVPAGAVRLWAWYNNNFSEWIFSSHSQTVSTHFIDIYPPQQ